MDPLWNPFLYLRNPCGGIIYRNIVLDFYRIYILQHAHHWSAFINFITYSIHTYDFLMKWCYRITLPFFISLFKKYYGFNKKSLVCQHCLITFFILTYMKCTISIYLTILTLVGHFKGRKLDMDFDKTQLLLKTDAIYYKICWLVDFLKYFTYIRQYFAICSCK